MLVIELKKKNKSTTTKKCTQIENPVNDRVPSSAADMPTIAASTF